MKANKKGFRQDKKQNKAQQAGSKQDQMFNEIMNLMRQIMRLKGEQTAMANLLRFNAVTEPLVKGDHVMIDCLGRLINEDGSKGDMFDGGFMLGYVVNDLGSGSLVEGFEEQLVGKTVGDNFEVAVTFPEDYTDKLKSKKAIFDVALLKAWRKSEADSHVRTLHENYQKVQAAKAKKEASIKQNAIQQPKS